ncbi:MAG: LPXTG cell wall anchor domain-containing protein, partial [Acidimicrobiales bacterium]
AQTTSETAPTASPSPAANSAAGQPLAVTGADTSSSLELGLGLIIVGAGMLLVSRQRRREHVH